MFKKTTLRDGTPYGILPKRIVTSSMVGQLLLPLECALEVASNLTKTEPFNEETFIEWLHVHLLNVSLQHIRDPRVGNNEREDCVRWVFGKQRAPFSCAACCEVAGYNHYEVQNLVEKMIDEQEKKPSGGKNEVPIQKKVREMLEYCRTRSNPCSKVYSVQLGRCLLQVMDHGDDRIIVKRRRGRVQNWYASQVPYATLVNRFNRLFDERTARSHL